MNDYILVTTAGNTDPIRGMYDGPILHIARNFLPQKIVIIFTAEIGETEKKYHCNEEAIRLLGEKLGEKIELEAIYLDIKNAHSYDELLPLMGICNKIKEKYADRKILLNTTSGTPQIETAFCMIAISDPMRYIPVQVATPEKRANKSEHFQPGKDNVRDWFEADIDNEENENRCETPGLLNYRRPIVQFQIESLIKNYDYSGAFQLYELNRMNFPETTGLLLEHAKKRLNLENEAAQLLARKLEKREGLYPVARADIDNLIEFYNSMQVKQFRGELNDFVMRLEVLTEYLGIYILKNCMRITLDEIADKKQRKNTVIYSLSEKKCTSRITGVESYLNEQFHDTKQGGFIWEKPLNSLAIVHIVKFLCRNDKYKKYSECADEMLEWVTLSGQVRNPAAHTIISITEDIIREAYDNKDSLTLCHSIRRVLTRVFGTEAKQDAFDIYDFINKEIKKSME